jgi:transcriptional regulator with XRE-family HTH domain
MRSSAATSTPSWCGCAEASGDTAEFDDSGLKAANSSSVRLTAAVPPAPVRGARHAGLRKNSRHRKRRALSQFLQLLNFGGDLHPRSMCAHAHLSSRDACVAAQSFCAQLGAHCFTMKQPKSRAVDTYRRHIAGYLDVVRVHTGWTQKKLAEAAGLNSHTTIGRALKREITLGYPALALVEEASNVPIPEDLKIAMKHAQQPTGSASAAAVALRQLASDIENQPEDLQQRYLEELQALQRRMAKSA